MNQAKISIIGDGGWGTTLAIHLCKNGHHVSLWGAFPKYVKKVRKTRKNQKFLPGISIPKKIILLDSLEDALENSDLIVLAVPSQFLKPILKKIKKNNISKKIFLSVTKGIDTFSLERMSELIHKELGPVKFAVLSGPTIAIEVSKGIPSTAVIASHNTQIAKKLQKIFNSPTFRIYTNSDIIGVELGGSIKNIIAIACGVCDGLNLGTNTKAAILSRGLAEMSRLGKTLGAKAKTFSGLSGLGDLTTTCFSPKSRNRFVGEQLGKGKTLKRIMASMATVAEGVPTTKGIYRLSQKHNISMPITTEVFNILYRNKKASVAVKDLMNRKTKSE
ncbi:MAG: NAD(P)H-dependent glycerol-3-phosphate dehydrogenase [Candidatus Aceula lacicola]|nr:NAD(P)H-dependent glycerol-3-phosphate dehydrogenase [Candidatus Aceula lacicola]